MGYINDAPSWVNDIYLIQETDPVLGGDDGTVNIQPKQLANRTRYLRDMFLVEHDSEGSHSIIDAQVAYNAAIKESKLALEYATQYLYEQAAVNLSAIDAVNEDINVIVGNANTSVGALGRAVPLTWEYSEYGFEFELFASTFVMRKYDGTELVGTVAGDESIDVRSTAGVEVGDYYAVSDADGTNTEVIKVDAVLSGTRIKATTQLGRTRMSGRFNLTSWNIHPGYATATNNSTLISDTLNVVAQYDQGKVVIRRDLTPSTLYLYWREIGTDVWVPCTTLRTVSRTTGYKDTEFLTPGGLGSLRVDVRGVPDGQAAIIDHICMFPYGIMRTTDPVQRPINVSPVAFATNFTVQTAFSGSQYRSLYGEVQKSRRFQVSSTSDFTNIVFDSTVTGVGTTCTMGEGILSTDAMYFWRCAYTDVLNETSKWSIPTAFSTGEVFAQVQTPSISSPLSGSSLVDSSPINVSVEPFSMAYGVGTHVSTSWQVANDSAFSDIAYSDVQDATNLQSINLSSKVTLLANHVYYVRAKFHALSNGSATVSEWSPHVPFQVKHMSISDPAAIFLPISYTGNGAAHVLNTGIDLLNDGGLVLLKGRDVSTPTAVYDTVRGVRNVLTANTQNAAVVESYGLENYGNTSFTVGTAGQATAYNVNYKNYLALVFKQEMGFFDALSYVGDGTASRYLPHALGTTPQCIIIKSTTRAATDWVVRFPSLNKTLKLNSNAAHEDSPVGGYAKMAYDTQFSLFGNSAALADLSNVNVSSQTYMAYLLASMPGVCSIGSYFGTGNSLLVNCGFSAGSRFIMIKRIDEVGDWYMWDTSRLVGETITTPVLADDSNIIVNSGVFATTEFSAGNVNLDPYLLANTTDTEAVMSDYIGTHQTGFVINATAPLALNAAGGNYAYIAIA